MTDVTMPTLFSNMPAEYRELVTQLDAVDALSGGYNGINRRLGLKGGVFRDIINGKEENVWEGRSLDVVVLTASKVGRTYFKGKWAEDAVAVPPTCWSVDGEVSAEEVPDDQRQSVKCADCPMNIKGSGEGDRKACRFNQRLAVLLEEEIMEKKVYQLQIPSMSIFGDAENGKFPVQAYARHLRNHKTPITAIVTKMSFDVNSATPKLFFSAVRPLTAAELAVAIEMQKSQDAIDAITFTVAKVDGVKAPEKHEVQAAAKAVAAPAALYDDSDAEDVPEVVATVKNSGRKPVDKSEPKPETHTPQPVKSSRKPVAAPAVPQEEDDSQPEVRVTKSNKPQPTVKPEVANVLADWDTEDDAAE